MKNETIKTKEHLVRALNELSYHNDVGEVKTYIQKAITALETVEKRRGVRSQTPQQTAAERWQFDLQLGLINPFNAKMTMKTLDTMIADENKKLAELRNRLAEQKKGNLMLG